MRAPNLAQFSQPKICERCAVLHEHLGYWFVLYLVTDRYDVNRLFSLPAPQPASAHSGSGSQGKVDLLSPDLLYVPAFVSFMALVRFNFPHARRLVLRFCFHELVR